MSTPTTEQLIRPSTVEEWQTIANELAAEVTRLHKEIDRLKGGDAEAPLHSHADWTHPLYKLWIEMGLDDVPTLQKAWGAVFEGACPKCEASLDSGPYEPFRECRDCGLCFIATKGSFALDTIERADERGPDA